MEGFDDVAGAEFGDFTVELCVDGHSCRDITTNSENQHRLVSEFGLSEATPIGAFEVRVRSGSVDLVLGPDDFAVETKETTGCCHGLTIHEIRLP